MQLKKITMSLGIFSRAPRHSASDNTKVMIQTVASLIDDVRVVISNLNFS